MSERNKTILKVDFPKPGFGITQTHQVIRTEGLGTCVAVGGLYSDRSGSPGLFMTHRPDWDHAGQISALSALGLRDRGGEMFVFAKDPEQLGLYFVSIDRQRSQPYSKATEILVVRLATEFPDFVVSAIPYGVQEFSNLRSSVEIDLASGYLRTDRETRPLIMQSLN